MKETVKARLLISGKVQGVFYRAETQKAAVAFGVNGWVRNNRDGTVEAVAEGEKSNVMSLINWCHHGSPSARVEKVDVRWEAHPGEFKKFDVVS